MYFIIYIHVIAINFDIIILQRFNYYKWMFSFLPFFLPKPFSKNASPIQAPSAICVIESIFYMLIPTRAPHLRICGYQFTEKENERYIHCTKSKKPCPHNMSSMIRYGR